VLNAEEPMQISNTGHSFKSWYEAGTGTRMKKARYVFGSGLFNNHKGFLVGRVGLEPTTKGL
jgi:hypothetical protein